MRAIDELNLAAVYERGRAFRCDADSGRLRCSAGDDFAVARAVPVDARQAESDRGVAGRLGLFGKRSYEKFVPASGFRATERSGGAVPAALVGDGRLGSWDAKQDQARIYYASTSRRWSTTSCSLLLRVGVFGRIKRVRKAGYRD